MLQDRPASVARRFWDSQARKSSELIFVVLCGMLAMSVALMFVRLLAFFDIKTSFVVLSVFIARRSLLSCYVLWFSSLSLSISLSLSPSCSFSIPPFLPLSPCLSPLAVLHVCVIVCVCVCVCVCVISTLNTATTSSNVLLRNWPLIYSWYSQL